MAHNSDDEPTLAELGLRLRQERTGRLLTQSLAAWNPASLILLILLIGAVASLANIIWTAVIKIDKSYDGNPLTGRDADRLARRKARQYQQNPPQQITTERND